VVVRTMLVVMMVVGLAGSASPCSVVAIQSPESLIRSAEVIVRVRAEGLSFNPGRGGGAGLLAGSPTQVSFVILDSLKGRLLSATIEFNGSLTDRDERNRGQVPYEFVRPSGSAGCFALEYRQGAEYLLFLRRGKHPAYAQPEQLTPYWAPLAPTNEQLFARENDPWFVWVTEKLRAR
jgi:hypothetical protein